MFIQLTAPPCTGRKLRAEEVKWLVQGHTAEAGQGPQAPGVAVHTVMVRFSKESSFCACSGGLGKRGRSVEKGDRAHRPPPNIKRRGRKAKKRKDTEKHLGGWGEDGIGRWAPDTRAEQLYPSCKGTAWGGGQARKLECRPRKGKRGVQNVGEGTRNYVR